MQIIECFPNNRVKVEFQDDYKYQSIIHYVNFKNGATSNPYDRTVAGVGYTGESDHLKQVKGKHTQAYIHWKEMLNRCYSHTLKDRYSAYYNICTVSDEWHNFSNFADWFVENDYSVDEERMHVDKDILVYNNTVYSKETCLIIPQRINMIFMSKANKWNLPSGIALAPTGRYRSTYNGKTLGTFDTLEEAIEEHDKVKKLHIIKVANEYKNKIPDKVYEALLNWKYK